ncbi:MAG: ferric reductase-like transmembrane domain-containing protein [Chloroflexota bacterium]|nr:ferric reductase-like transmembrane domain-containing protein [Chloroflexota bacterium]
MIDHTLSWEIARVGGLLAYLLASGSVAIGILLSLKLRSSRWPRFLTTELHRFVTVLALVFTGIHGVAVWVDPFTGFAAAEVLVPLASHYRPLWLAFGIVGGYLLLAVWASEYVRRWIGYGWWRRFHYLAFAVFALATVHGLGSGSDTRQPWALGLYAASTGSVLALTAWRLVATRLRLRIGAVAGLAGAAVTLVAFTLVGPAQAGWNAIANDGNGSGASAAWLASHPSAADVRPTSSFSADLQATFAQGVLSGSFAGGYPGSLELRAGRSASNLSITFASGWSCAGSASDLGDETIAATCVGADGSTVEVTLSGLYQTQQGVTGQLTIRV